MHQMRKIICLLAVLALILPAGSAVFAETVYTDGFWEYTADGGYVTVTGYFGREENVTVPSVIAGNPVSVIAADTFANTSVKSVMIPDTVMEIREGAIPGNITVSYYSPGAAYEDPIHSGEETNTEDNKNTEEKNTEEKDTEDPVPVSGPVAEEKEENSAPITETEDDLGEEADLPEEGEKSAEKKKMIVPVLIAVAVLTAAAVTSVKKLPKKNRERKQR